MKRWLQSLLGATVVFTAWWVLPPHTEPGGSPRTRVKPETTAAMGFPWDRASSAPSPGDGVGLAAQSPLATVSPPVFRSTAQGRLLIDEQARIDIERVAALHDRADALALLSEVAQPLGEGARREVQALYEQMVRYEQALSTALANEPDHPRIEDARRQLQTMQALRVEHFGDRAEALFGEEESQQQRLLDEAERVMRSRGISLEEAIGHAQALLMQSGGGGKKPPP